MEQSKLTEVYSTEPTQTKIILEKNMPFYILVKRITDLAGVIVILPIALPLITVFSILIKLETPGPVFYKQERLGFKGKKFCLYKLRSMGNDAEKDGEKWAILNDPRVTKIGKFIRKTRIDELPQLVNVVKGEMSFIGPRPERPSFTEEFNQLIPGFKDRLKVKPGLTGWAQVNGGYDILPKEKLEYDLYYIKNQGMKLDTKIAFRTFKVIFTGDGAR